MQIKNWEKLKLIFELTSSTLQSRFLKNLIHLFVFKNIRSSPQQKSRNRVACELKPVARWEVNELDVDRC